VAVVTELVDWHTHVWLPEHLGEFGRGLDDAGRKLSHQCWSGMGSHEDHDAAMARSGVDAFIVLGLCSRFLQLEIPNDYIAEQVRRHPGRAVGVGSVDPNDPEALMELRRMRTELGLQGLKLSPPYQDFDPHGSEAWAIYELADQQEMFLLFHQGSVFHPKCSIEHANPVLLDRVASAFPRMRIIICHCGQPWTNETVMLMARHANVYTDVSARLNRPWQLYTTLMTATDYHVTDKILFGSDFPVFQPDEARDLLLSLDDRLPGLPPVPDAVLDGILHERPFSLLGIDPAAN
jgi:predicted TIM-barrel fold metal-dependent hydrolase